VDRGNKIFIAISIIALSAIIYAANAQKITNPNTQPASEQSQVSSSSDEKSPEQPRPDQSGTGQSETAQAVAQTKYADGTYEGAGTGKNPGIKVSVSIVGDKITDITVISCSDNEEYFSEAAAVIPDSIIEAQSTNVDTVSGATLSSNGIIKAVEDALSKAVKQ